MAQTQQLAKAGRGEERFDAIRLVGDGHCYEEASESASQARSAWLRPRSTEEKDTNAVGPAYTDAVDDSDFQNVADHTFGVVARKAAGRERAET